MKQKSCDFCCDSGHAPGDRPGDAAARVTGREGRLQCGAHQSLDVFPALLSQTLNNLKLMSKTSRCQKQVDSFSVVIPTRNTRSITRKAICNSLARAERQSLTDKRFITLLGGEMNYSTEEHEVADYYSQAHAERSLEPTSPQDGYFLLVDENGIEESIGFLSIDGAFQYARDYWQEQMIDDKKVETKYSVYQLKKVL